MLSNAFQEAKAALSFAVYAVAAPHVEFLGHAMFWGTYVGEETDLAFYFPMQDSSSLKNLKRQIDRVEIGKQTDHVQVISFGFAQVQDNMGALKVAVKPRHAGSWEFDTVVLRTKGNETSSLHVGKVAFMAVPRPLRQRLQDIYVSIEDSDVHRYIVEVVNNDPKALVVQRIEYGQSVIKDIKTWPFALDGINSSGSAVELPFRLPSREQASYMILWKHSGLKTQVLSLREVVVYKYYNSEEYFVGSGSVSFPGN